MAERRVQLTYGDAKQQILEVLLLCAAEHDSGRLVGLDPAIDNRFDVIDSALPRHTGPEFNKLIIAFEFCAGWLDSSNHDWKFYKGIKAGDWPRLARLVVADLVADREISDSSVLSHFGPKEQVDRPSLLERLNRFFSR
jgi:hypothetical protein